MPDSLASLHDLLTIDSRRESAGFSDDIEKANRVLHNSDAKDFERQDAIELWLLGREAQPCVFGKIAAKQRKMHFCFVTGADLRKSDQHVSEKIQDARKLWKRRALNSPEHGFMLIVCDRTVAYAIPDDSLRRLSSRLQELAGWPARPGERGNVIVDEWVYLKNRASGEVLKFTFSVDFFASAADGKWWHDHRVPGGVAFTANSLGHMARYKEWYEGEQTRVAWSLRSAMKTIDLAAKGHPHCPVTYLLDMRGGVPVHPVNWRDSPPLPLSQDHKDKDCGTYEGYLHTDHSVRAEFFQPEECPVHKQSPYQMDFTYIFDTGAVDNLEFMVGEPVSEADVVAELGPIGETHLVSGMDVEEAAGRPREVTSSIEAALDSLRQNAMTDDEIEELLK